MNRFARWLVTPSTDYFSPPALALLLLLIIAPTLPAGDLKQKIRSIHRQFGIQPKNVGIRITSFPSGKTIYRQNAGTPFIPASNVKVLTALAALDKLGPSFRFRTALYAYDPDPSDKTIRHLYVRGGGDPTISKRFYDARTTIFQRWAKDLREKGIRKIQGNVVLDDAMYEKLQIHPTWNRYKHSFWYTAPVNALIFNDNCVYVRVFPRARGQKARVKVDPPGSPIRILNETRTISREDTAKIEFKRLKNTWKVRVKGQIRPNTARREWITVPDPTQFFGSVLTSVLKNNGVSVGGTVKQGSVPEHQMGQPLIVRRSRLKKSLRVMLEDSQNLFAESIFKQIGYRTRGTGSWSHAVRAVMNWYQQQPVSMQSCRIVDGSGLSRKNRLTPTALTDTLQYWLENENYRPYLKLLPVAGRSGTLENRLNKPPYQGRIAAKTGTLDDVITLSGIAGINRISASELQQTVYLFSFLVNQPDLPGTRGQKFTDELARTTLDQLRSGGR